MGFVKNKGLGCYMPEAKQMCIALKDVAFNIHVWVGSIYVPRENIYVGGLM